MRLATSTGRDYERAEAVRNRIHAYIVSRRRCGACPQKSAALGRFSRTYPAQYTQNIIHTVAAAQVLQSGQRFGVGHARLNFRKTVEGMFKFTSRNCQNRQFCGALRSPCIPPHEQDQLELLAADISHSNYFFIAAMASIASSRSHRTSAFRSLHPWSCLRPLCHPHQDVEYLLYSEPLRRPSDLPIFGAIAKISRADLRTPYSDGRSSSEPALRRSPRWHALSLPRLGHFRQRRSFRYWIAISTRLVTWL